MKQLVSAYFLQIRNKKVACFILHCILSCSSQRGSSNPSSHFVCTRPNFKELPSQNISHFIQAFKLVKIVEIYYISISKNKQTNKKAKEQINIQKQAINFKPTLTQT